MLDPSVIHYYRKEYPERMMQNINTNEENLLIESTKREDRERLSVVMVKPKFKIT